MMDSENNVELLNTRPKPFCFVLMPFDKKFNDVYQIGIKESCDIGGAYCERVDEQIFVEAVTERVFNQIAKSDFIIADMSGRNPNVFYEVGYAHALGKRTILLTSNVDDIPFDLKHLPHIIYNNSLVDLREKLTRQIEWLVENPPQNDKEHTVAIRLFYEGKRLSENSSNSFLKGMAGNIEMNLTIYNTCKHKIDSDSYTFNVITPTRYVVRTFKRVRDSTEIGGELNEVLLPDQDKYQYTLMEHPILFPENYVAINLIFHCRGRLSNHKPQEFLFKVIMGDGNQEFRLNLETYF